MLLTSRILDDPKQKALFTKSDIKDLFNFEDDDLPSKNTGIAVKSDLPDEGKIKLVSNPHNVSDLADAEGIEALQPKNNYSLDSEIFVEQEIFPASSSASSQGNPKEDGGATDQDSNSRDRRLLQALFDGEALSAVYDHSFIEPGMGGSDAAREARAVQEQASVAVDQALKQLQASAPSYRMTDQKDYGSVQKIVQAADEPLQPPNRFGGSSSARMLAGLKANQVTTERRETLPSSTYRDTATSTTIVRGSEESRASSSVTTAPKSVSADILGRLGLLFSSGVRKDETGLTTNTILQHFGDLGDQYASLFKESLHQVATLKNGKWYAN